MPPTRDLICAALSAALGAWAFYKVQSETKETFDPIMAACTSSGAESESSYDLVPYEVALGGPFVCLVTQFIYKLVVNAPAGFIVWGATIALCVPIGILTSVEAGRSGSKGPVRYPTVIGILAITLAISVAFPGVWVPGFLLLGGSKTGAVLPRRAYAALYLTLPGVVLTLLAFNFDPSTYQWTLVAGLLGSPLLAMSPLLLWGMESKGDVGPKDVERGAIATSNAYAVSSLMALGIWAAVLHAAYIAYGLELSALWDGIWTNADPCVRFMTIDAVVLFLSALVYIASVDPVDAIAALFISPLLGPGASVGTILWEHERVRAAKASAAMQNKKKS